jgi:hypothetical protein
MKKGSTKEKEGWHRRNGKGKRKRGSGKGILYTFGGMVITE